MRPRIEYTRSRGSVRARTIECRMSFSNLPSGSTRNLVKQSTPTVSRRGAGSEKRGGLLFSQSPSNIKYLWGNCNSSRLNTTERARTTSWRIQDREEVWKTNQGIKCLPCRVVHRRKVTCSQLSILRSIWSINISIFPLAMPTRNAYAMFRSPSGLGPNHAITCSAIL
jgi:hypothetical protein